MVVLMVATMVDQMADWLVEKKAALRVGKMAAPMASVKVAELACVLAGRKVDKRAVWKVD